ncbi:hypothetical protein [Blastopirellula retiformator]|uniref:Pullulanase n=1 Tax=Blastopirellula retiformator TaxID=2527970 RepID=A0A5C5V4F0_9BACT|nr:hypothetical protein [Blastopirellula retiformator]TWT32853.1 Pullulanase [Blastopirellula retiformator]
MATTTEQSLDQVKHHLGMGAIPYEHGTAFRVWAPNADSVAVIGEFNDWNAETHLMTREEHGYWYADIQGAKPGQRYRFMIRNGEQELSRIDPYARKVTNSVGDGIIYEPDRFEWEGDAFELPTYNQLVIYEMHVGTFNRHDETGPGGFHDAGDNDAVDNEPDPEPYDGHDYSDTVALAPYSFQIFSQDPQRP